MINLFDFTSKRELRERIETLEKDVENLKHSHKELRDQYNGLVSNYENLMNEIKSMCGMQEVINEEEKEIKAKEKRAENQRTSFSDAIAEVFDWGDNED